MKAHVALPEQSIQRKVILAILCNSLTFETASNLLIIGKAMFETARRHYRCLESGKEIIYTVRSVMRYKMEYVFQAVVFILSPANIKALSWGTQNIVVDGREIDFP